MTLFIAATLFAATFEIEIAPPRVRIVPPATELRILCRSDEPIEACTEFLGEVLTCECRRIGREWKIAARAQLVPYMYVSAPRSKLFEHEKLHLEDLRKQIAAHLAEVTGAVHANREVCESVAQFESATFNLRMNLFKRLSNRSLD